MSSRCQASRTPTRRAAVLLVLLGTLACGGGGAVVQTTDPSAAALDTVAVTPSAVSVPVGGTVPLSPAPLGAQGQSAAGATLTFTSGDELVAAVDGAGVVRGVAAGSTTVTVRATRDGVTRTTTVPVTVTAAPTGSASVVTTTGTTFVPATVTIAAGGSVEWRMAGATHNVTFGASQPPGGDVPDTPPGGIATRAFPAAGTYDFECTRHGGMTGQVVVQAGGAAGQYAALSLTPETLFLTPGGTGQLTATPTDGTGAPLTGLGTPTFRSLDAGVASVGASGLVTGIAAGTTSLVAELAANGVLRADTSAVTVGTPTASVGTTANRFVPEDVEIAPGGTVLWTFSQRTHNVTFERLQPPGGNVPNSPPGTSAARTFPAAGDYDYVCTLHAGMKGRIRVR